MRATDPKETQKLLSYIGKKGSVGTQELKARFASSFGVGESTIHQRLQKLEFLKKLKCQRSSETGNELQWSLSKSLPADEYGRGKKDVRQHIWNKIKDLDIERFVTLCGTTILDPNALERRILEANPESRGDGAEEDLSTYKRVQKNLDAELKDCYRLEYGDLGDVLRGLPEKVKLDFVFADFCGGVGRKNLESVEEAFRRARKGTVIAVTSTLGLRQKGKPGGYYALYKHSKNNQLCLATELNEAAADAGWEVDIEIINYRGKKTPMFVLIFTVK